MIGHRKKLTMELYFGTLYRFGDTITCLAEKENECVDKIMEMYVEIYKNCNEGSDPRKDTDKRFDNCSYYDIARSDIEMHQYEVGKAYFCE